jgi:hypothetical protein
VAGSKRRKKERGGLAPTGGVEASARESESRHASWAKRGRGEKKEKRAAEGNGPEGRGGESGPRREKVGRGERKRKEAAGGLLG